MKTVVHPFLVLALLLGGCSSMSVSRLSPTAPGVSVAKRSSTWGEVPSYNVRGQSFNFASRYTPWDVPGNSVVAVDLLVNRDGTVRDAAVVASSGERSTDKEVVYLYRNARYSLRLAADDPAPYVVRQKVVLRPLALNAGSGVDYGRDYRPSPNYTETYNPTPMTVNGMFR